MLGNYMYILCTIFSIAEFMILVTLSGVLLTFSIFLNLLLFTLSLTNPLFLAVIRHLGTIIISLMQLTVFWARSVLLSVNCSHLEVVPDIQIADMQEQIAEIIPDGST